MDRREFLQKLMSFGAGAASTYILSKTNYLFGDKTTHISKKIKTPYDLAAIKGGEPDKMFDEGIKQLGGMKQFVKKGDVVCVKPNIGFDSPPEMGANTNPILIKRIVEHCKEAGAKKIYVFDHSTMSTKEKTYKISGIESAVKQGGGQLVPAENERYYKMVKIPGAHTLDETQVHEVILESNVLINVPVLKSHWGTQMTCAMKNLMGVVWDRWHYHNAGIHECISDFCLYKKPTLNVVDAYKVMVDNGPRGYSEGDLVLKKMQLLSTDMVAIDTASAKILGIEPDNVNYIGLAYEKKIGNINLNNLNIKKISI